MEQYFAWRPPTTLIQRKQRTPETHPDWLIPFCPQPRAASGSTSHVG
jgi:hypothetical protein